MSGDGMLGVGMRRWRIALAVVGCVVTLTGLYFLVTTEPPAALAGLVVWLIAAVVVHDGILVPAVSLANGLVARGMAGLPATVVIVARVGFAVGVLLTFVVLPELIAQARPHANPTILVGDYALRLLVAWALLIVSIAVVTAVLTWRTRRKTFPRRSTRG